MRDCFCLDCTLAAQRKTLCWVHGVHWPSWRECGDRKRQGVMHSFNIPRAAAHSPLTSRPHPLTHLPLLIWPLPPPRSFFFLVIFDWCRQWSRTTRHSKTHQQKREAPPKVKIIKETMKIPWAMKMPYHSKRMTSKMTIRKEGHRIMHPSWALTPRLPKGHPL